MGELWNSESARMKSWLDVPVDWKASALLSRAVLFLQSRLFTPLGFSFVAIILFVPLLLIDWRHHKKSVCGVSQRSLHFKENDSSSVIHFQVLVNFYYVSHITLPASASQHFWIVTSYKTVCQKTRLKKISELQTCITTFCDCFFSVSLPLIFPKLLRFILWLLFGNPWITLRNCI